VIKLLSEQQSQERRRIVRRNIQARGKISIYEREDEDSATNLDRKILKIKTQRILRILRIL